LDTIWNRGPTINPSLGKKYNSSSHLLVLESKSPTRSDSNQNSTCFYHSIHKSLGIPNSSPLFVVGGEGSFSIGMSNDSDTSFIKTCFPPHVNNIGSPITS
jgi:hypothetical protein